MCLHDTPSYSEHNPASCSYCPPPSSTVRPSSTDPSATVTDRRRFRATALVYTMTSAEAMLLLLHVCYYHAAATTPSARTYLPALDAATVALRPGTELFVGQPLRHSSESVLPNDKPWERGGFPYATVLPRLPPDTGYIMWYSSMLDAGPRGSNHSEAIDFNFNFSMCVALSKDGINWLKPSLKLIAFNGSLDTNIVLQGQDMYGSSVAVDEQTQDPNQRYKLVYWAQLGYGEHHAHGGMWTGQQ